MQQDIVAVLDEDHGRLIELSRCLGSSAQPGLALTHFNQFAVMLGGHLTAVRKVVYPALKAIGWAGITSTLLICHAELTHSFAELLTLKKASGLFAESLSDVLDATQRLIERERRELFPVLREQVSPGLRLAMALDANRYLAHHFHAPPPATGDIVRQSTRDWVEEARLLLGGMRTEDGTTDPREKDGSR